MPTSRAARPMPKEITEAFYDIGEALAALEAKDVVLALGRKSFAEVCEKDAGLSASTGERLVATATSMTADEAANPTCC